MQGLKVLAWVISGCLSFASAQSTSSLDVRARMVVTSGHFYYNYNPPVLTRDDLIVTQAGAPATVTSLIPLRGDRAGLELFLLVDNCSSCEPGNKFEELRKFLAAQPPTTAIGVAYIKDGRLQIAEKPTPDRDRVLNALNPPSGSKPASPFRALAELIKGWNPGSSRRAVLMISNGLDPAALKSVGDQAADAAIAAAQRAGVTVYTIYHPSADYLAGNYYEIYSGQMQLERVALETGGEPYFLSFGPLPSVAPALSDIAYHLANQYLVEFLAKPSGPGGALAEVKVKAVNPDIEIVSSHRVWIPGSKSAPLSRTSGVSSDPRP